MESTYQRISEQLCLNHKDKILRKRGYKIGKDSFKNSKYVRLLQCLMWAWTRFFVCCYLTFDHPRKYSTNSRFFNLATTDVSPKPNGDPLILVPHPVVSRQVMLMPREEGAKGSWQTRSRGVRSNLTQWAYQVWSQKFECIKFTAAKRQGMQKCRSKIRIIEKGLTEFLDFETSVFSVIWYYSF